jgi:hypothetical protein
MKLTIIGSVIIGSNFAVQDFDKKIEVIGKARSKKTRT